MICTMPDWMVKMDDIIQSFRIARDSCGTSSSESTLPTIKLPCSGVQNSASPASPSIDANTDERSKTPDLFGYAVQDIQKKLFVLQGLRSNPSLVEDCNFSVPSVIEGNLKDQPSIGLDTLPESDEGSGSVSRQDGSVSRKNPQSISILAYVVLVLALLSIGLIIAIMVRKSKMM